MFLFQWFVESEFSCIFSTGVMVKVVVAAVATFFVIIVVVVGSGDGDSVLVADFSYSAQNGIENADKSIKRHRECIRFDQ